MDSILAFIGLMKQANALSIGHDAVNTSCRQNKARLLLLASDSSENAKKAAYAAADTCSAQIVTLSFDKRELGNALGSKDCAMLSVNDTGFALSLSQKLQLSDLAANLTERLAREKRRKQKKVAGKTEKSIAKRGNKL